MFNNTCLQAFSILLSHFVYIFSKAKPMQFFVLGFSLLYLVGCSTLPDLDPVTTIKTPGYRHPGGATVTLVSVVSKRSASAGHSALIVNGTQRIIFDPAGSLFHKSLKFQGDVIYDANPSVVDGYIDYHTRNTHDTVVQTVDVADAVAEDLLKRLLSRGYVWKSFCAQSSSTLLRATPGFENIWPTFSPQKLMNNFGKLEDVRLARFSQPGDVDKIAKFYAWVGQKPLFNIE